MSMLIWQMLHHREMLAIVLDALIGKVEHPQHQKHAMAVCLLDASSSHSNDMAAPPLACKSFQT